MPGDTISEQTKVQITMPGAQSKIIHVTTVHKVPDPRIFLKECATLHANNFDLEVLACINERTTDVNGVKVTSVGSPSQNRFRRITYQPRILAHILRVRPAIVHFHDPELLPLMLCGAYLLAKSTSFIFDMHEDYEASLGRSLRTWPAKLLYKLFMRLSEPVMEFILAEDSYSKLCRREHVVVHNFPILPSTSVFRPRRDQIVYVGAVDTKRGVCEMIQAFTQAGLPDWKLIIIGNIDRPGLATKIRAEIEKLNAEDRIQLTGYLPAHEALQIVSESKIGLALLHPEENYLHSLPTKVFEYLVYGVPVILSDFPFYRTFFSELPGIHFVDPLDTDAITKKIWDVASKPEMNGGDIALGLKAFSWEGEAQKLLAVYRTLLQRVPYRSEDRTTLAC